MGYTETPTANSLPVEDFNANAPEEAPPSYDQALSDPQVPNNNPTPQFQRPQAPPPKHPQLQQQQSQQQYQRPPNGPPPGQQQQQQQQQQRPQQNPPQRSSQVKLRPATVVNPNPYLPWQYSESSKQCKKCANTGFKIKNGAPCKSCWKSYRKGIIPPASQAELEKLVNNPPPPMRINPNVTQLPPGVAMLPPIMSPGQMGPSFVRPGDPRIGGVLCPRCHGKGLVHFFLDTETCPVCRGMGRVNNNGRPL